MEAPLARPVAPPPPGGSPAVPPPGGADPAAPSPPSSSSNNNSPNVPTASTTTSSSTPPSNNLNALEDSVVSLTQLLARETLQGSETDVHNTKKIKNLFSPTVPTNDVVLVLPSLDIQLSEKSNGSGGGALPNVGETSRPNNNNSNNSMLPQRPTMTASVLTSATKDAANAEHEVAKSLSETTSWTKSTVPYAAAALVNNVSESFSRLVDSRMKAWTLLLLRHSLSTGDESSRKRLLGILAASLKVETVSTKFRTLPLPDSAKGQLKEAEVILPLLFEATVTVSGRQQQDDKTKGPSPQQQEEPVILRAPGTIADFDHTATGSAFKDVRIQLDCSSLLSSMVEQARILVLKAVAAATKTQVPSATGMMTASFGPGGVSGPGSKVVVEHHHHPPHHHSHHHPESSPVPVQPTPMISASKSLASFRSALNLTPPPPPSSISGAGRSHTTGNQSPQLQKARSSALRLNNILQGKKDESASSSANLPSLGLRKNRSVRWNTPGEIPTLSSNKNGNGGGDDSPNSPKKARSTHNAAAKLKSFKSFGRPHRGDFGSGPRNATFGEFGGRSTGMWGRDGRMAAHPTPMNDQSFRDPVTGEFQGGGSNATFNLLPSVNRAMPQPPPYSQQPQPPQQPQQHFAHSSSRPSIHLASGGGSYNSSSGSGGSSLPRTATVLESLLLKKSMR